MRLRAELGTEMLGTWAGLSGHLRTQTCPREGMSWGQVGALRSGQGPPLLGWPMLNHGVMLLPSS